MIKIITALGNPNLNNELKKYEEFNVIGNDIIYFDGIMELLGDNINVDYIVISEILEEKNNIEIIIEKILEKNRKIKIIAIINRKNKLLENKLLKNGILDIYYDDSNIEEIINFLKTKNIEYLNIELREEINNLKKLIIEKNTIKNYSNNDESKIIGISGARGIGKTYFSIMAANAIKKNKKILLVDFDLINSQIGEIYNKKIEYSKINENNFNNFIIKIDENLDILIGLNFLYLYNKLDFSKIKNELNKMKKIYNYIIVDTYTENTFENNKYIYDMFDSILILGGTSNIDTIKNEKLINIIIKKWKINNRNIYYLFYRTNFIDILINKNKFKNNNINNIRQNKK